MPRQNTPRTPPKCVCSTQNQHFNSSHQPASQSASKHEIQKAFSRKMTFHPNRHPAHTLFGWCWCAIIGVGVGNGPHRRQTNDFAAKAENHQSKCLRLWCYWKERLSAIVSGLNHKFTERKRAVRLAVHVQLWMFGWSWFNFTTPWMFLWGQSMDETWFFIYHQDRVFLIIICSIRFF